MLEDPNQDDEFLPEYSQIDKDDQDALVLDFFSKIRTYLSHYNSIKIKYKNLAATWFVAAFIGCGYILVGKEEGLNIDNYLSILFMTVLSSCGIGLISFLDIAIYHKLIESLVCEIVVLENKFRFLMRTDHITIKLLAFRKKIDPQIYDGIYYSFFIFVLLIIGTASLSIHIYTQYSSLFVPVLVIGLIFAFGSAFFIVNQCIRFGNAYRKNLKKVKSS